MSIRAVCPHCETSYRLSRDLLGKSMKCPNPDCQEVFVVADTPKATAPPAKAPTAGTVDQFMPVLDAEVVEANEPQATVLPKPKKKRPKPVEPELLKATPILPAEKASPAAPPPAAPRVMVWGEDAAAPPGEPPPPAPKRKGEPDYTPIRTRNRQNPVGKMVLFGLLAALVLVLAGTGVMFFVRGQQNVEKAEADADDLYKEGKFAEAKKRFEDLSAENPGSDKKPKWEFFAHLAGVRAAVTAVTTVDNPAPALEITRKFLAEHGESPLAQPNSGFGSDVVQAGQQLCKALAGHAQGRVKEFRSDRKKMDALDAAEKAIAEGEGLVPVLEKYRDKTTQSFDAAREEFAKATAETQKERKRLADLLPWRTLADNPTDQLIEKFELAMKAAGLAGDPEAVAIGGAARAELRKRLLFVADQLPAEPAPPNSSAVTAFAARVNESPKPKPAPEGTADAVFAVVRGVLFVLDAHTGEPMWAERVASDVRGGEVPVRYQSEDGGTDWLLVASVLDGEAGLTARQTRTGSPVWHQPLPAPVIGRPVRIGSRLFVGLKDDAGSVLQFDLYTGGLVGRGEIRQPIGGGLAALRGVRTSHGFLLVPADARRMVVFEVGKEDEAQRRLPPQVVRVIDTDHPKDSLRGEPLVLDPDDRTAPRRVVFTQTDLPTTMRVRSFTLPSATEMAAQTAAVDEKPQLAAEVTVPGWASYPPLTDGERVAVATDSGTFAVFALNQPGNFDKPLFQLPGQRAGGDQSAAFRGLVVSAEEDNFWAVMQGQLVRLRAAIDPAGGFKVVPGSNPRPVGEPVSRGIIRPAIGLGYVATKEVDSTTVQMLAFDLATGEVAWQRQLGTPAAGPPLPLTGGGLLFTDSHAGVYKLTVKQDSDVPAVDRVSDPLPRVTLAARPQVFAVPAGDGKTVWVVAGHTTPEGQKALVRKIVNGKQEVEGRATIPDRLAGTPTATDTAVFLPLANGYVYRIGDTFQAVQGPSWRGQDANPDTAVGHLLPAGPDQFFCTDGHTRVYRYKWKADQATAEKAGGPWEVNDPIATSPRLCLAGGKTLLLIPGGGEVSAFDPDRPSPEPLRRWKGAANLKIAADRITHLAVIGQRAVFATEGKNVVGIDAEKDGAEWGLTDLPYPEAGDVIGIEAGDGVAYVTYSSGHVRVVTTATGAIAGEVERAYGAPLAAAPAVPAGTPTRMIVANSDGSLAVAPVLPRR